MSAPTLSENWQRVLCDLAPGWDSYSGERITTAAIKVVESFAVVPCSDGGIQLEICVSPDGKITSASVAHGSQEDRP